MGYVHSQMGDGGRGGGGGARRGLNTCTTMCAVLALASCQPSHARMSTALTRHSTKNHKKATGTERLCFLRSAPSTAAAKHTGTQSQPHK